MRLTTNQFRLRRQLEWNLNLYRVEFVPPVQMVDHREDILLELTALLGSFIYDSIDLLLITRELPLKVNKVRCTDFFKNNVEITFEWLKVVQVTANEAAGVLDSVTRLAMDKLNLVLLGQNYYDPRAAVCTIDFGLFIVIRMKSDITVHFVRKNGSISGYRIL